MNNYHFQYCQKIVVFSADEKKVLLARRKGEADYDGTFSFIGGKMETTDGSILNGLKREKTEEVGGDFKIKIYPAFATNLLFTKKDGNAMILPHYYAVELEGEIQLNEEYSEYRWVLLDEIKDFEPKIATIPEVIDKLILLKEVLKQTESVII